MVVTTAAEAASSTAEGRRGSRPWRPRCGVCRASRRSCTGAPPTRHPCGASRARRSSQRASACSRPSTTAASNSAAAAAPATASAANYARPRRRRRVRCTRCPTCPRKKLLLLRRCPRRWQQGGWSAPTPRGRWRGAETPRRPWRATHERSGSSSEAAAPVVSVRAGDRVATMPRCTNCKILVPFGDRDATTPRCRNCKIL